jgi:hypothetical protein
MRPLPRWLLVLAYAFMSGSALVAFFIPLSSFSLTGVVVYIYVWAITIGLGGAIAAAGAWSRKGLLLELIGITLLFTGFLVYAVILGVRLAMIIGTEHLEQVPGTAYVGATTTALILVLARRYVELWRIFRAPTGGPP